MKQNALEKKLGATIVKFRTKRRLTQQQAAELYACSLRWWQHLERGRNVSLLVLARLAKVLRVEIWMLLK